MLDEPARWRPTHAHIRAVVLAFCCCAIAVLARRPDLAVLAVPFVGAAAWGARHRPRAAPQLTVSTREQTLFEGQSTVITATVGGAEPSGLGAQRDGRSTGDVVAVHTRADRWLLLRPATGAVAAAADGGTVDVALSARALRWGRHELEVGAAACTSRLGAYRTTPMHAGPIVTTTLPLSAEFDAGDAAPRPAGLVGLHRANRQGSGSEPAEVRPFRPGDRLRHINWRVSSRAQALHVTSTWSDRDTHVLLLLDTEVDVGWTTGVDGRASSLDTAVRAAAAIADHYLRAGDRVALVDLGRRIRDVGAGSGRRHLRRVLDALVLAEPAAHHRVEAVRLRPVGAGALVIALSPLIGHAGLAQIAHMVHHGLTVIVVDTLPDDVPTPTTSWEELATRLRVLERAAEIDRLQELGVPVVRWHVRGTLDEVLRDVSRLALAPRPR